MVFAFLLHFWRRFGFRNFGFRLGLLLSISRSGAHAFQVNQLLEYDFIRTVSVLEIQKWLTLVFIGQVTSCMSLHIPNINMGAFLQLPTKEADCDASQNRLQDNNVSFSTNIQLSKQFSFADNYFSKNEFLSRNS